jgi:transcriptional regulator with XRE-family HTH domain
MKQTSGPVDAPGLTVLQRLMRHYSLSTRDIAARTKVSRSTISRIARGELPRVDVAILMAKSFHVTVEELWGSDLLEVEKSAD